MELVGRHPWAGALEGDECAIVEREPELHRHARSEGREYANLAATVPVRHSEPASAKAGTPKLKRSWHGSGTFWDNSYAMLCAVQTPSSLCC
jgi:hypothetical protein